MVIFQLIKNSKLFLTTVLLLILYSIEGNAVEMIKFTIKSDEDNLRFILINKSDEEIVINHIFSVGPSGKRGNIELYFIDTNNKKYILSSKVNFKKTMKSDFISLSPNAFIGKIFSFDDVKSYYNLVPGEYELEGFYKNYKGEEYGAFIGSTNTSRLKVNIK